MTTQTATDLVNTHLHIVSGSETLAGDVGAINALILQGVDPAHASLDGAWSLRENADGTVTVDGARAGMGGTVTFGGMQFLGTGANAYRLYALAPAGQVAHAILSAGATGAATLFSPPGEPGAILTDPATGPSAALVVEAGGGNTIDVALSAGDPETAAYYVTGADDTVVLDSGTVALMLPGAASAFAVQSQPGGDTLVSGAGIGTLRIRYRGGAGMLVFQDSSLALAQAPAASAAPAPAATPAAPAAPVSAATSATSAATLVAAQQAAGQQSTAQPGATGATAATAVTALAGQVAGPVSGFAGPVADYQVAAANGSFTVVDAAGLSHAGGGTLAFSDGLGLSDPDGTVGAVARLYQACLNRTPDYAGLQYWSAQAEAGLPLAAMAADFAGSAEFAANYGALSDAGYVAQLYQNVLHRAGEADGVAYWDAALAGGASRGTVLESFAQSVENTDGTIDRYDDPGYAEAYRLYRAGLDRMPDRAGLDYWTGAMHAGTGAAGMAEAFAGSAEFQASYAGLGNEGYVRQLYHNVLNREGDLQGISYWAGQLNAGADRASVLQGFADGPENLAATASATHAGWVFLAG